MDGDGRPPLTRTQVANWRTLEALALLPFALATFVVLMLLGAFAASPSTWASPREALPALVASLRNLLGNRTLVLAVLAGLLCSAFIHRHIRERGQPTGQT